MSAFVEEEHKDARDPRNAVDKEIHTAESIYDYLKRTEEQEHQEQANEEEITNFTDYLEAQRRLKSQRLLSSSRNLASGRNFMESLHMESGRNFMTEESEPDDQLGDAPKSRGLSKAHAKSLRALSVMGRRQGFCSDSAEWQAFLNKTGIAGSPGEEGEEEEEEEDAHSHHETHIIPFYSNPVQRQRWSDDQVLPHVNWGDLFFDLFFVAAAYNLGGMLISAMNADDWPRGVVYFIGIFGSLYNMWENELTYASRFTVVDYAHRLFEVVRYFFVSVMILHIKPLDLLADSRSIETFLLTLAMFVESVMQLTLHVELLWYAHGDRKAIVNHTRRKLMNQFIPVTLVYMAAAIVSGVLYFRPEDEKYTDDGDDHRLLAPDTDYGAKDKYADAGGTDWSTSDLSLALCFLAYVINLIYTILRKTRVANRNKGDIRDHFVPSNIDYMIHRYGEWIMLMIGESVLSLLIVETVESKEYYIISSLGVLTVIVLQALKFESEPSHADGHALWRSVNAGMFYSILIQILSMGLIAFGVSYKVMLTTTLAEEGGDRMLAAVPLVTDTATAATFSGSLTVVLVSLEVMLTSHRGVRKNYLLLFKHHGSPNRKMNWPLVFIAVSKLGLILFTATLSQWETDPTNLTIIGFVVVTALAISRIIGWGIVHKGKEIKQVAQSIANSIKRKASAIRDGSSARSAVSDDDGIEFDKAIWDTSFDAIIVTDKHGVIKHVNETAIEEFGYATSGELVGHNIAMLVGGGEAEHHHKYLEKFNKTDKTSSTIGKQRVLHSRRKDGSEFPCIIGIKQMPNSELLVGYVRNMSEVSQTDKLLSPTERLVDDSSFDAIIVTDYKGVIQQANATTLTEFGYESEEELVGENISILVGGGDAHKHDIYLDRFHKMGKSGSTIGQQRVLHSRRKDGTEFPCIIGIKKLPETELLIGYIRNMSGISADRKALEVDNLTRTSKNSTEDLLEESFDAVIVTDRNGVIKRLNQTTLDAFRYEKKEELLGKNISMLVGGGEARKHHKYLEKFNKSDKTASQIGKQRVLYSRRKDGTEFPCIIGIKRIPKSDLLVGYIRDMSDISQQNKTIEITNIQNIDSLGSGKDAAEEQTKRRMTFTNH